MNLNNKQSTDEGDVRTPMTDFYTEGGVVEEDLIEMMHCAVQDDDFKELHRIIELGISVDSPNSAGITPMHSAAIHGHSNIAELLIHSKCDINYEEPHGITPLMLSARLGRKNVVDLLLQHGAKIHHNIDAKFHSPTLLHWASRYGWIDVIQHVIERGELSTDAIDRNGQTPLMWAARFGKEDVVTFLIKAGADVNRGDVDKTTALHFASKLGQLKVLQILLRKEGLNFNLQDYRGETPLHRAGLCKMEEVIKMLMDVGVDITIKNNAGETAFKFGMKNEMFSPKAIRLFLQRGIFFDDCDHWYLFKNPDIKEHVLKDVGLCTQSIINKFHNQSLPILYKNPNLVKILPSMPKFQLNSQEMQDIENFVKYDIKVNSYCNVKNARPIVLKLICVETLIDYFAFI